MNVKTLDILNNVIETKKKHDDFLDQKILEGDNSLELFECNFQKEPFEINNNNINIDSKIINNISKNIIKEEEKDKQIIKEIKEDNINGGIDNNNDKIEYKKINKNKKGKNNIRYNINNGYNKIKKIIEQINNGSIGIKNIEKNNNEIKFYNKRKMNKKNNSSNSMDFINVQKNKKLYKKFALSKMKNEQKNKVNKSKANSLHNKSEDNNLNRNFLNENGFLTMNNRFNIHHQLFEIKLENMEKFRLNSKNEKNYNILNNILMTSPKRLFTIGRKDLLLDDETIKSKNRKNKIVYNKNNLNPINNSNLDIYINKNKLTKEFLEDEVSSLKSKKSSSKPQSQNSLSSFLSNNSSEKFSQIYERFKEMEQKQKEKLENLKKVKEDNDNKICSFSPKINKKSRNIKEDYYARQKKNFELQKEKYEKIKMEIKKRREEKLLLENKNNLNKINKRKVKKLNIRQNSASVLLNYKNKTKNLSIKNIYCKDYNLNINNYKLSYLEKILEKLKEKNNTLTKKNKEKNIINISSPVLGRKIKFTNILNSNKEEELYLDKKEKNKINIKNCNNNELKKKTKITLKKMNKSKNKSAGYFIQSQEKINKLKIDNKNKSTNNIPINNKNIKKYKTNNIYKKSI